MAGGGIFFAAEFIAAAAWTDPPYSYSYHFISDLGVHGPSTGFGQYMYSPLAWVMNTGFFLFGLAALAGVIMLRGVPARRHWRAIVPATFLAAGGVVLSQFPGSGEAIADGTAAYHGLAAFAAFIGGNTLVIMLGRMRGLLGFTRGQGRLLVSLGILGFACLAAFIAMTSAPAGNLIGLVERGVVYPVLIGLIIAGAALWKQPEPGLGRGR